MKTNAAFAVFDRLCEKVGVNAWEDNKAEIWRENRRWEHTQTDDQTLWDKEQAKEQLIGLRELLNEDPAEAFRQYVTLAGSGSVWAMCMVAACYALGTGVCPDTEQAVYWYDCSSKLGNRQATLELRRLLDRAGQTQAADAVLADGVSEGWGPALFWHAWYGLRRSNRREPVAWTRPLLQRAAEQGSPAAQWLLAREMTHGRFGYAKIPQGWKLLLKFVRRMKPEWSGAE